MGIESFIYFFKLSEHSFSFPFYLYVKQKIKKTELLGIPWLKVYNKALDNQKQTQKAKYHL